LFFWGENGHGQLGDGTTVNKSLPCKFSYFDNKVIVVSKVLIAKDKTCILTKDHRVYFFGKNIIEDDSQNKNSHLPIDISSAFSLSSDDLYISVSLFFDGFSAITKSGRLFLWQDKQIKTIGGVINKNFPFLIEITSLFNLLENDKIVQFSQGFNHFGVITLLGQLFLWGNNDFGQLGTINHTSFNEPHNITYNLPLEFNDKVLLVSCGNGFTSFLTKFGRFFLCGNNEFGQIGIGKKNPYFTNIIEITDSFKLSSNDKLVNVKSYGNFNYALTSIGRLFVWGKSPYLIINNSSKIINSPFEVTSLFNINKNDQIVDIEFFETYALVKTKNYQTLLWTVDKIIHE
jgi:alpha-tubulin suppressor-like RCC1 family protein